MKNPEDQKWYIIDASNVILGKLAVEVAKLLMGKGKVGFVPYLVCGDQVIVVNSRKIAVTGKKMTDKIYFSHSGYPGGAKTRTLEKMLETNPNAVIEKAVKGMLPKNKLNARMMANLHVYADGKHVHEAQKPIEIKL